MKQSMLALAIPALFAAGTAQAAVTYQADDGSNVDLYGRLGFNVSDKKNGNSQGDFDGRIGFTARQTVNEQVAVIGMAQYQVNAAEYANNVQKNSSDLTARYVWAGLDGGEWGKVTGSLPASSCSPTSATCLPPPMSPWRARPAKWTPLRSRCSARTVPCNTRTPSAIWMYR
ncbi:porin [Aeromonas sp. 62-46]|uniref:porin n=1 Tax=Aeromonas sp. 62-46 TaxID=1895698 RepID=UPI002580E5A3|nr:porin [Aeromonas sp. 62-46]